MGFWQGMNAGLLDAMATRSRKDELDAAKQEREANRADDAKIREEDRKFQRELLATEVLEKQRSTLIELKLARAADDAKVSATNGDALLFFKRVESAGDTPEVQYLRENPTLAASLEQRAQEIEKGADGFDPNLSGKRALDLLVLAMPDGGVTPSNMTIEDIQNLDLSDPENYTSAYTKLTTGIRPQGGASWKPAAYYKPDPDNLKTGKEAFEAGVLAAANQALIAAKGANVPEDQVSELLKNIDGYSKVNSAERLKLQMEYGVSTFVDLLESGNPYIKDLAFVPEVAPYAAEVRRAMVATLEDPESSAAEKAQALSTLRLMGVN